MTYYALDLEQRELERTLTQLAMSDVGTLLQGKVDAKGMLGTYSNWALLLLNPKNLLYRDL